MSYAPDYDPSTSFADDESNQASGRSTVRTASLDVQLADISASINALNANQQKLQRDDDKLRDLLIEPYALAEQTRAMMAALGRTPRGAWAINTDYAVGDLVQRNAIAYICNTAHNSGPTFNVGFWLAISGDGSAATSAAEAEADRLAAAASAAAASGSAGTASGHAAAAAAAAADAVDAQNAAQNAADSIAGLAPVNLSPYMLDLLANNTAAGARADLDAASAGDLASPAAGKGADMLGRGLPVVDSIAELRGLLKTSPAVRAFVTGYYAAGDGGGGPYYLDAADTTSSDNGGTVIVAADGARWKLVVSNGTISVRQFGAVGDGTTNDRGAIAEAINTPHSLDFPAGTYHLGDAGTGAIIFNLSGQFRREFSGRGDAKLTLNVTANVIPRLFGISNCAFIEFSGLHIQGLNFDRPLQRGPSVFWFDHASGSNNNITFDRVFIRDCVQGWGSPSSGGSTHGVVITNCRLTHVYYGMNFQGNVHDVHSRGYICDDVWRSYFPYGCTNHDIQVESWNHEPTSADCLLKSYGTNLSNIKLRYIARGNTSANPLVMLEHDTDTGDASINDIDIWVDNYSGGGNISGPAVAYRAINGSGVVQASSTKTLDNITIRGRVQLPFYSYSNPGNECRVVVSHDIYSLLNYPISSLVTKFDKFVFCSGNGDYSKIVYGQLSTQTVSFDASRWDSMPVNAFIRVVADDAVTELGAAGAKKTIQEDAVFFYNAGGGAGVTVRSAQNITSKFINSAATIAYAGSGEYLTVTFGGYTQSSGRAVVTLRVN